MRDVICSAILLLVALPRRTEQNPNRCDSGEKLLAVADLARDSLKSIKNLYRDCGSKTGNESGELNSNNLVDQSRFYADIILNIIDFSEQKYVRCGASSLKFSAAHPPRDCLDVLVGGQEHSGVYTIQPTIFKERNKTMEVYCDMETDGGGWTVIQRRDNFTVQENFFRKWEDYKYGFGRLSKDFWLGNENIYALANETTGPNLRFDLKDATGERRYAWYKTFHIDSEENMYKLHVNHYRGDAGDAMTNSSGMKFSTLFQKNDEAPGGFDCAIEMRSGWWFEHCASANPNGVYGPGRNDSKHYATWSPWKANEGLKFLEIKIRRY